LHRTGASDPLGKLDDRLDEQRISGDTKAALQVQAAAAGKSLAEWVRFVLDVQAHGIDRVRSLHDRKFDLVGNLSAARLHANDGTGTQP
jgi:plasmid stability protein